MFQSSNVLARWARSGAHHVVIVSGLALSTIIFPIAADAELSVELVAGIGRTDNIIRSAGTTSEPEIDATIYSAGIELLYEHESARAEIDVRGSMFYVNFEGGPFNDETLPALDASAIFRITEQSLSWFALGNIGQQSIDPLEPITPGNREDISYITTGPRITIPIGSRFEINSDVYYSNVQYEVQPLDNDRTGAELSLVRQIAPNRIFSLNVGGERTEYKQEASFPQVKRYDAYLRFATEGSRNQITVDVGWNTSEQAGQKIEEPLVDIEWGRQMSPTINLSFAGGTRISDAAESFRDRQQDSVDFETEQDQQFLGAPFRENYADFSVTRRSGRTTIGVGLNWREEDYAPEILFDREVRDIRLDISHRLSSAWQVAAYASVGSREYFNDREDDDTSFGATLTLSQFRSLLFELRVEQADRESNVAGSDYTENRAYLGLRYTPSLGP